MPSTQTVPATRSPLETTGRVAASVGAVALLVLLIGRIAGWSGFQANDDGGAASGALFVVFLVASLVAIVVAVVLAVKGRGRAALPLVGYVVVAVVLSVLENAGVFG